MMDSSPDRRHGRRTARMTLRRRDSGVKSDAEGNERAKRGRPDELLARREDAECVEMDDRSISGRGLYWLLEVDGGRSYRWLMMSVAAYRGLLVGGQVLGAVAAWRLAMARYVHAGCGADDQHQDEENSSEIAQGLLHFLPVPVAV